MRTFCLVVPTSEGQDGLKVGVKGDLNPEADKSPHKERGTNMCVCQRERNRDMDCVWKRKYMSVASCAFSFMTK